MNYIIGIFGVLIGLFLWSNIIGSLFASLPIELKLKKSGVLDEINWIKIVVPVVFSSIVIIIGAVFSKYFLYGTLLAGVLILFNLGNLRKEALENIEKDMDVKPRYDFPDELIQRLNNVLKGKSPHDLKLATGRKIINDSGLSQEQQTYLVNEFQKELDDNEN